MQNEQKTQKTPKAVVAVVVRTYYPDGTTQSARLIDHNYKPHREWLGKHCFWAMREGLAVATAPAQKAYRWPDGLPARQPADGQGRCGSPEDDQPPPHPARRARHASRSHPPARPPPGGGGLRGQGLAAVIVVSPSVAGAARGGPCPV